MGGGFRGLDEWFLGWEKSMAVSGGCGGGGRVLGGPVVPFSHWRQVAAGNGRQTAPAAQRERGRNELNGDRGVGESGLRHRTANPSFSNFFIFPFFWLN